MCRLFAFKSIIPAQVHTSLVQANNALIDQSQKHPDGWGFVFYQDDIPQVFKSDKTAKDDDLFIKLSSATTSKMVMAHIRKATWGEVDLTNAHPFQYGRWTFSHNGNIKNFEALKSKLIGLMDPKFKTYILGKTDSEILFYIILTELEKIRPLNQLLWTNDQLEKGIFSAITKITNLIGLLESDPSTGPQENYLNILLSNGSILFALQGGQELYYCTYKTPCPERESCSYYQPSCEQQAQQDGPISHLILASEPFSGNNIWEKLSPGDFVSMDSHHLFRKGKAPVTFT